MPDATESVQGRSHEKYERLIAAAQKLPSIGIAVAHPCDEVSLESAVEAARLGFVRPILVGPVARIRKIADRMERLEAPTKARLPVIISYSTAPKLKMSLRTSTFFPSACSGDM